MNLPRNIVQIGEVNKTYKIYIEDYILSYIKQQIKESNQGMERARKVALYGREEKEHDITYYFLYGAIALKEESFSPDTITTQERQEAREYGQLYFDQPLKGYFELQEELPEGFFVLEGLEGKFVKGYACFYEKNETMLTFMLSQKEEKNIKSEESKIQTVIAPPVTSVEQKTYRGSGERNRQLDYYRKQSKKSSKNKNGHLGYLLVATLVVMVILRYGASLEGLKESVQAVFTSINEQKIPDKEDEHVNFVPSDVTDQFVLEENKVAQEEGKEENKVEEKPEQPKENDEEEQVQKEQVQEEEMEDVINENVQEKVEYIIQKGDTLLSISWNTYGSVEKVKEICDYNKITDADSIQVGQTIFLP